MAKGTRPRGDFCWFNMLTGEPDKARDFFAKLLGWTYSEIPGVGHIAKVDGLDVGGVFDLANPQTPPGTPPHIGVVVLVDSADQAGARVASLGGRALPPMDVMDQGRMVVCFDPGGANFDLWEARKSAGMQADSTQHGAPSWFELMTNDVDRCAKFYADLFGWQPETMPMGGGSHYTTFKLGQAYVGGMMGITPEMGAVPTHWGVYFTVRDADKAAEVAKGLGATLFVPPQDVPGVGRFSGIVSPQGVHFFVIKYAA